MTEQPTLKSRFLAFKSKYFPERQLFLRSEGRVRFVTFGSKTQMVMASVVLSAVAWGATTTVAYITRDAMLQEKDQKIADISNQYQTLSGDFTILEKEIEKRAKELEQRQKLLEDLVGVDKKSPDAQAVPASVTVPVKKKADKTGANDKTSQIDDANAAGNQKRRETLIARLNHLEDRQRLAAKTMIANIDKDFNHVDTVLAKTKVTVKDLLQNGQKNYTAMGGPFIPEKTMEILKGTKDEVLFDTLVQKYIKADILDDTLNSLPIGRPAEDYYISSKFGRRIDPFRKTWATHKALDMAAWPGTKILASAEGTIVKARYHSAYGRMIEIDHGNGFRTRYGHMRKLRVKKGQRVDAGQHIGDMGKTGRATSSHLHYEVWFNGVVRDPLPYLKAAKHVQKIKKHTE